MIPTRRFWYLVLLGIPLCAIAAQVGAASFWAIYNLGLLLIAFLSSRLVANPRNLRITRRFDPVLSVRAANRVDLNIWNDGALPLKGLLRDEPPYTWDTTDQECKFDLPAGADMIFHYSVTPPTRGESEFQGTFLKLDCPLGLVNRIVKLDTQQPVNVYPNVLALKEFDLLKQRGKLREMGVRRSRRKGLGSEFESLRDYTEGDDYRKVDWKATSRKDVLVVRQYEQERNQAVILAIDIGRYMLAEVDGVRKLDRALDAALMLAHAAGRAGDLIGLLVFSESVRRYIPPRKGKAQLGMVLEAIHDLVAEPVEPDPVAAASYLSSRWKRRSLFVLFSDAEDEDYARELTKAWAPISRRHLTLIARVSDPLLGAAANLSPQVPQDIYRKAAGQLLQQERRTANQILLSAGIQTLEAEPQDLTAALLSFYFTVKERSLL